MCKNSLKKISNISKYNLKNNNNNKYSMAREQPKYTQIS